ncbi:lytic polysaccharide monooxygenase, partial [Hyaloscypha hepaticicola]
GPVLAYLAKVPAGKTAATWDGSGTALFKIFEEHLTVGNGQLNWASYSSSPPSTQLPTCPHSSEHIALHQASQLNGVQSYTSCAEVTITGNGAGTPGPFVAFPAAYKATDPGIHYNINPPAKNDYVLPGPAIWTG